MKVLAAGALLLVACGPTLTDELHRVSAWCPYDRVQSAADERGCAAERRAVMAAHDEAPTRWHDSLWAFRILVAEQVEAGRIGRTEATFAVTDYQRRLEVEANQLGAAADTARATELGNYLTVWRAYFPPR